VRTPLRRWVDTACLAIGAGCAALMVQDEHAGWRRQVIAFAAAALPVVAAHVRAQPTQPKAVP
jgi:hypothetical protein